MAYTSGRTCRGISFSHYFLFVFSAAPIASHFFLLPSHPPANLPLSSVLPPSLGPAAWWENSKNKIKGSHHAEEPARTWGGTTHHFLLYPPSTLFFLFVLSAATIASSFINSFPPSHSPIHPLTNPPFFRFQIFPQTYSWGGGM